jgi:hypothetical protein
MMLHGEDTNEATFSFLVMFAQEKPPVIPSTGPIR